jgi:hypothetical protein
MEETLPMGFRVFYSATPSQLKCKKAARPKAGGFFRPAARKVLQRKN